MDERSLSDMAARVAAAGEPPVDYLTEIVDLVMACREGLNDVACGVLQGRLSEEAYRSASDRLASRARAAADALRASREEMGSLRSRTGIKSLGRVRETAGAPESTE